MIIIHYSEYKCRTLGTIFLELLHLRPIVGKSFQKDEEKKHFLCIFPSSIVSS